MRVGTILLLVTAPLTLAAQGSGAARATRDEIVRDSIAADEGSTRGLALLAAGQYDNALKTFEGVLTIRRRMNDSAGLGRTLNSVGASHYQLGQYEAALENFLESLAYRRALRDREGVARVLSNIGKSYQDLRQFDRALTALEAAVALADSTGSPFVIGYALTCLGELQTDMGRLREARASLERSVATYNSGDRRITPDDSASGWALNTPALARVDILEGKALAAVPRLIELLEVSRQRDRARGEARANLYLAEAYRALGDRARALAAAEQALQVSKRIEQRAIALRALRELADLHEQAGNSRVALAHLRAYQALRDTVFDQTAAERIVAMESRAETEALKAEQLRQSGLISRQRLIVWFVVGALLLGAVLVVQLVRANRRGRDRGKALQLANTNLEHANAELRSAIREVRTLKGLIPICARCKRIRDDEGFWSAVEDYISERSDASFSHGICTHCGPELYGDVWETGPRAERTPADDPERA